MSFSAFSPCATCIVLLLTGNGKVWCTIGHKAQGQWSLHSTSTMTATTLLQTHGWFPCLYDEIRYAWYLAFCTRNLSTIDSHPKQSVAERTCQTTSFHMFCIALCLLFHFNTVFWYIDLLSQRLCIFQLHAVISIIHYYTLQFFYSPSLTHALIMNTLCHDVHCQKASQIVKMK